MQMRITSPEEMHAAAERIYAALSHSEDRATILGVSGELGAGKTTFIKAMAALLGVEELVTSPTFVIEKVYALPPGGTFRHLVHIDAYRLEGGDDLTPLGWEAVIADPGTLILIEWPEHIADALPEGTPILSCAYINETTRCLTFPASL